jgi:hypothetical protein
VAAWKTLLPDSLISEALRSGSERRAGWTLGGELLGRKSLPAADDRVSIISPQGLTALGKATPPIRMIVRPPELSLGACRSSANKLKYWAYWISQHLELELPVSESEARIV